MAITEHYFPTHYYDNGLIGAQVDQECLKEIIKSKFPDLHKHLASTDIDITSITLNWFLAIFIDAVPFETLLRIWDCFLLEGSKVLYRYSCALLFTHKAALLEYSDSISIFKQLKYNAKYSYDVEGLTKVWKKIFFCCFLLSC